MKKIVSLLTLVVVVLIAIQKNGVTEEEFKNDAEKIYAARNDRSILKDDNFEDLVLLGQLSSSDAGLKHDVGDPTYIEDVRKAVNYFEKALKMRKDNPHPYRGLAVIYYYDFNDIEKFKFYADKAMDLEWNSFDLPFIYAEMYEKQGETIKAREYYMKAKAIMEELILRGDPYIKESPPYKTVLEYLSKSSTK